MAKEKLQNIENSWKKTQYLMNTLYNILFIMVSQQIEGVFGLLWLQHPQLHEGGQRWKIKP